MDINTAKFRLYNSSPFYGTILFNLPVVEDDKIPTMGVDGEKLYYNKKWWDTLTYSQQLGVLCHEVGHLFLGHIWRRKGRDDIAADPKTGQMVPLWNIAADISVNNLILTERKFSLPTQAVIDNKYSNMSTEKIYEELKKKMKKMTPWQMQKMFDNMYNDKSKWSKSKGQKGQEQEAKWKNIGKQAMEQAKLKGNLPEGLTRLFKELEPKEDWRQILLQYVQNYWNDYSFNPVDRRFLDEDFALPDIKSGEKIDWIAVAIDTSGSIDDKQINHFVSELKAILSCYDKVKVKLTFCDAETTPFEELEEFDLTKIKPVGGGGTDFRPVFKLIKQENNDPVCLIYFTDLMGEFPSASPLYDTLWINTSSDLKPPFGKVVPYEL